PGQTFTTPAPTFRLWTNALGPMPDAVSALVEPISISHPPRDSDFGGPDKDVSDNHKALLFFTTPRNPFDLAALGTDLRGKVGDTVTATVRVLNQGPAPYALYRDEDGMPEFGVKVSLPAGVDAVTVPKDCTAQAGGREYLCRGYTTPNDNG